MVNELKADIFQKRFNVSFTSFFIINELSKNDKYHPIQNQYFKQTTKYGQT